MKGKKEAISQKSEYFPPTLGFRSPAAEAGEACGLSRVEGLREALRAFDPPFSLGVKTTTSETKMKLKNGACLTGALIVVSANLQAALINIGSGPKISYFTLESPNLGLRQYAVSYDLADNTPGGGTFLLDLIEAGDPEITFVINDFGDPTQPNEFFSSVTFNGVTESNDFSPGGSTFTHWVAGGEAGAAGLGVPDPVPIDDESWTLGSGLSVNFRLIDDGSNDALVFSSSETPPTSAPIPEPSGSTLLIITGLLASSRRRHS